MVPQIITIILQSVGLLLAAHYHGKEKTGKHNFWVTFISTLISLSILYWGGFYDIILKP